MPTPVNAGRFTAIGSFPPGSSVSVCEVGTATLVSLYADASSGTSAPNPVVADVFGCVTFFAVPGDVDVVAADGDTELRITVPVAPSPANAWPE